MQQLNANRILESQTLDNEEEVFRKPVHDVVIGRLKPQTSLPPIPAAQDTVKAHGNTYGATTDGINHSHHPDTSTSNLVLIASENEFGEIGRLASIGVESSADAGQRIAASVMSVGASQTVDMSHDCAKGACLKKRESEIDSVSKPTDSQLESFAGHHNGSEQTPAASGINADYSNSTWAPRSLVIKESLQDIDKAPVFDALHKAIEFYFEKAGKIASVLAADLGVSNSRLSALRHKVKNVMATSRALIESLEVKLLAPAGSFTRFVITPETGDRPRSKFVQRLKSLRAMPPYRIHPSETTTPILNSELIDLLAFKTDVTVRLFDDKISRGRPWRSRRLEDFHRSPQWMLPYCTTHNGTMVVPSAMMCLQDVRAFFGALYLIDPELYKPAEFSLVWMCSADLMEKVVAYLDKRFGGYCSTIDNIVLRGKSLINPKSGFVTQNAFFAGRLPPQISVKNWKKWGEKQNARFLHGLKKVREHGSKKLRSRNPEDPIREYLKWQHPIEVLEKLITAMVDSLPRISGSKNRYAMRRDILLVRMLAEQPLRALMYGNLTYTDNNQGSLYRQYQADGTYLWAIRFEADEFKNWRTAQYKNYDVCFSVETSEEIDLYFREVRIEYPNGPRVFTVWESKKRREASKVDHLERTVLIRTKTMLGGCVGFGMNAFRNIVATEIIRNHVGGYQIAADALHDEVDTVKENYAHIAAKYSHSKYIERILSVRQAGRAAGEASATINDARDAVNAMARSRGVSYEEALTQMSLLLASRDE